MVFLQTGFMCLASYFFDLICFNFGWLLCELPMIVSCAFMV